MKNIVIKQLLIPIVLAVALLYSCKGDTEKYTSTPEVNWEASREIYLNELNKAIAGIDTLKQLPVTDLKAK